MFGGWHLHQSLVDLKAGANLFLREAPALGTTPLDAQYTLSKPGAHYLAGLLVHARSMTAFCTPTLNGYDRFWPNALALQSVLWGRDNRGAMLRIIGRCHDRATRIENRVGESVANLTCASPHKSMPDWTVCAVS